MQSDVTLLSGWPQQMRCFGLPKRPEYPLRSLCKLLRTIGYELPDYASVNAHAGGSRASVGSQGHWTVTGKMVEPTKQGQRGDQGDEEEKTGGGWTWRGVERPGALRLFLCHGLITE